MTGSQQQQPPRPNSRTTSAPTSPLKETKRASFLGKVTSLSQVTKVPKSLSEMKLPYEHSCPSVGRLVSLHKEI